jgi:hypothetical protein
MHSKNVIPKKLNVTGVNKMSIERDYYAEIRDIVEEWFDESGMEKSCLMMRLETMVDDVEQEL